VSSCNYLHALSGSSQTVPISIKPHSLTFTPRVHNPISQHKPTISTHQITTPKLLHDLRVRILALGADEPYRQVWCKRLFLRRRCLGLLEWERLERECHYVVGVWWEREAWVLFIGSWLNSERRRQNVSWTSHIVVAKWTVLHDHYLCNELSKFFVYGPQVRAAASGEGWLVVVRARLDRPVSIAFVSRMTQR
jgi:hypothetical protein